MLPDLTKYDKVAIDVETTGLHWFGGDWCFGIGIAADDFTCYLDTRTDREDVQSLLKQLPQINIVNHNLRFDMHFLEKLGGRPDISKAECTMLRACLIDEHLNSYSLDSLAKKYLNESKDSDIYGALAGIFGGKATRNQQIKKLVDAPRDLVAGYCIQDCKLALALYRWQEKEIRKQDLGQIVALEQAVFPVVFKMERAGVRVDIEAANKSLDDITARVQGLQNLLRSNVGFEVNPNSPKDLFRLFNPEKTGEDWFVKGHKIGSTGTGKPCFDRDSLDFLAACGVPEANMLIDIRTLLKARDTFITCHILERQVGGRVYPSINQLKGGEREVSGTSTGRFSYTEPALQQIPSRNKEVAKIIKSLFLPDEGTNWSSGDLSQHEYRVFAHYANNPETIEAYRENPYLDLHQHVADMLGIPRSASRPGQANAKQINLGMVFCMSAGGLAREMGMSYTEEMVTFADGQCVPVPRPGPEGQGIYDLYHSKIRGVKELQRQCSNVAKRRGYLISIKGRHINLDKGSFHKSSGLLYQTSSADLNKENLVRIDKILEETGAGRLLLNVHDSYEISVKPGCEEVLHLLKKAVQDKKELRAPIVIDFSNPAANWHAATKAGEFTRKEWP